MKKVTMFISILFLSQAFANQQEPQGQPPDVILRPKIEYKAGDLRDPFKRQLKGEEITSLSSGKEDVSAPEKPLPSLTVQGIIWGGSFPQAIINNKVVKAGDIIEGARITEIKKEGIKVIFENREYNLSSPAGGSFQSKKKLEGGKYEK